jgi:hypothetical protein
MAREHTGREAGERELPAGDGARVKPSSPAKLLAEAKKKLKDATPRIAHRLAEEAMLGRVPHIKLLIELGVLDKADLTRKHRKEKSLEQILKEQWRKEKPMYDAWLKECAYEKGFETQRQAVDQAGLAEG